MGKNQAIMKGVCCTYFGMLIVKKTFANRVVIPFESHNDNHTMKEYTPSHIINTL
jgi:hypothetical protein